MIPTLIKQTLIGEHTADLIWPTEEDLKRMDLHSERVKLSEITVHYDTSLTAIQLKLSNGA